MVLELLNLAIGSFMGFLFAMTVHTDRARLHLAGISDRDRAMLLGILGGIIATFALNVLYMEVGRVR